MNHTRKLEFVSPSEVDRKLKVLLFKLGLQEKMTPNDIKNVIYHERDLQGSVKLSLAFSPHARTEKALNEVIEIINLAWNYLPHRSLGNLSPYEKFQETYQGKKAKKFSSEVPKYDSTKTAVHDLFAEDLPQTTAVVRLRENRFGWEFSQTYSQNHEKFTELLERNLSEKDLERQLKLLIADEPYLFIAGIKLSDVYWDRGDVDRTRGILELMIKSGKELFPPDFDSKVDQLPWAIWENRDFLSLLLNRAQVVQSCEGAKASIPYYEELIFLNPNDNQGVRGILATLYLKTNQEELVLELAKKFPQDTVLELTMGYALALIRLGKGKTAGDYLDTTWDYLDHAVRELLKMEHRPPENLLLDKVMVGGEDEAYYFYQDQGSLWQATRGGTGFIERDEHQKSKRENEENNQRAPGLLDSQKSRDIVFAGDT